MIAFFVAATLVGDPGSSCAYDRQYALALDERTFDQDSTKGWRVLELKPQCDVVAADLIRDYRRGHHSTAYMLFWHEGQLRADAGETKAAVALFRKAYRRGDPGWNLYVDGTIAFLMHDRNALEAAREKLAAEPRLENLRIGGQSIPAPWPPNLNVLDGLLACFDKPYAVAYGPSCTHPFMKIEVPDH